MKEKPHEPYFIRDKEFYKSLLRIMVVVALQNFINYGVNMADNIMLGNYGQAELSGAAVISQIFFIILGLTSNLGAAFSVLAAQYWGQRRVNRINMLGGVLLRANIIVCIGFFVAVSIAPYSIVRIFTSDTEIIEQAVAYLGIFKYIFVPYGISSMIMDMLRNVETVSVSFYMSIASLAINVFFNYIFIFGKFGCPELGIRGAAIATLIARLVEVTVLVLYVLFIDKKLHFFKSQFWKIDAQLEKEYFKVALPVVPAGLAWTLATPVQTALLGKISADAIAANSVTNTFYQLLKVFAQALSSASAVLIGKLVGERRFDMVRSGARTIEIMSLAVGTLLGMLIFILRKPLLSFYSLSGEASALTDKMILLMCIVIIGMSYEINVLFGTIRAGGDTFFPSCINITALWGLIMPLAFLAVYVWKLDAFWVVVIIQSEQIVKCIPAFFRVRCYDRWIKPRTSEKSEAV